MMNDERRRTKDERRWTNDDGRWTNYGLLGTQDEGRRTSDDEQPLAEPAGSGLARVYFSPGGDLAFNAPSPRLGDVKNRSRSAPDASEAGSSEQSIRTTRKLECAAWLGGVDRTAHTVV
jgi:hypothetical protein